MASGVLQSSSAATVAIKDSRCFVLRRSAFRELAEEDPKLGYVLLRDLGEILVERIIKTTKELKASLMFRKYNYLKAEDTGDLIASPDYFPERNRSASRAVSRGISSMGT